MPTSTRTQALFALLLTGSLTLLAACGPGVPTTPVPRGEGPSLVVLIVIDQGRADYLERFRPLLSGGLAWLLDNGTVFTDAHHNHSMTATAPGHASLSTGLVPARSGIYSNYWFDTSIGEEVYSGGSSADPSPIYLRGTAFGDWLKARDPRSKVFTASPKDRSAVLMGGQGADAAFSYWHSEGVWWTGEYYDGASGPWFEEFLETRWPDQYFGTLWEPLIADQDIWAEYDIVEPDPGAFDSGFPYPIGRHEAEPDDSFYRAFYSTPMMDGYLAELAKVMIDGEQLGADGSVDFLGLSFSAIDAVGHDYGPNSPEILDTVLRLDTYLGDLLDHIDQTVGLEHVIFALSADHGVAPLPEFQEIMGAEGKRLDAADIQCAQRAGLRFRERFGEADWFIEDYYIDTETVVSQGLSLAEVEREMAALLEECEAIDKVWTSTELIALTATRSSDPIAERFGNSYIPGRSPHLMLQLKPYYQYYPGRGTTHGSVHDYDSQVPLALVGPGIAAGTVDQRVHTVDLAPTLAALIGVAPPEGLDGVDRSDLVRTSAAP